jgi:hypothetical protein
MKSNFRPSREGISDSATVLLLAAKEDREFGDRLRLVLRLPSFQRKSMINSALAEMQAKGEPALLMQAIALFADDVSAARMLSYLEE